MPAHTSGPWSYGFPTIDGIEVREADCQVSAGGFLIANVTHGPMFPVEPSASEQREANARLIAAAPELLGLLKETLTVGAYGVGSTLATRIEAAIAKAEAA